MGTTEVALQVGGKVADRRVALRWVLGEGLQCDGLKRLGDVTITLAERAWSGFDVLTGDISWRVSAEWSRAGQHFVQHHGERVHVASWSDLATLCLLWGQVGGCAHDGAVFGGEIGFTVPDQRLRDSEVRQLYLAFLGDQDIAGLYVHVDHALAMSSIEGGSHVDGDVGSAVGRHWPFAAQDVTETSSLDVLHHDEWCSFVLTLIEHTNDVLMVEAGNHLCLAA